MSMLGAVARMKALRDGRAVPLASVRHVRLAQDPLVLIPLRLAGEAAAPLAAMVGNHPDKARVLLVPQPRNRDLRFAFFAELGRIVLGEVAAATENAETIEIKRGERKGETYERYLDAPQILVPNRPAIEFLRLAGRATRFRQTEGEWPVAPEVPVLGRWLTWFADRSDYPGASALCAMTELLAQHWASGQSSMEDGNLAALLGWIDPGPRLAGLMGAPSPERYRTGQDMATLAEDPLTVPPAGPTTDPTFDNEVLAPTIAVYDTAPEGPAREHAEELLRARLTEQMEPTWRLMWHAVGLLRELPEAAHVPARFEGDRQSFTNFEESLDEGLPQARHDGAVAAARRLASLEGAASRYTVQRALDDPLVMAEHRLTGEAFRGEVVWTDPDNVNEKGLRRPLVQLITPDRLRIEPGMTVHNASRTQKAAVLEVDGDTVTLRIENGMGNARKPLPGSIPEQGQRLCFTTFADEFRPGGSLPEPEETPWTHGGPPEDRTEPNETAAEEMTHEREDA
ncbi:hypothetical protein LO762_06215 [Actinocorallia sp. API 0066]|uniref:hypothetical protein n=1 Tax=Actinocorallia sp. API 0066 TaxID=2896846 RepID=UPI001E5B72F6|nr:hypothetical protein [Actinocorallia sp. API 0066]MCD0448791.1 hypothetical protein [Actinocorallia sp. API 0066]